MYLSFFLFMHVFVIKFLNKSYYKYTITPLISYENRITQLIIGFNDVLDFQ